MAHWTFLSNHSHVLFLLCKEPDLRMQDVAEKVDISERYVQRIVHDLVEAGYLVIHKEGRRNHYEPILGAPLRHPLEAGFTVGDILAALQNGAD